MAHQQQQQMEVPAHPSTTGSPASSAPAPAVPAVPSSSSVPAPSADGVPLPLPNRHTRRTMEGEAYLKPRPKPKPKPRPTSTAGGDGDDATVASTATGTRSVGRHAAPVRGHRRNTSLPNLADSKRIRSDLFHKLGIENGGKGGDEKKMMLPPGASAKAAPSQTGRTSLLGGVAPHREPLKYESDPEESAGSGGVGRKNSWQQLFGLGKSNSSDSSDGGAATSPTAAAEEGGLPDVSAGGHPSSDPSGGGGIGASLLGEEDNDGNHHPSSAPLDPTSTHSAPGDLPPSRKPRRHLTFYDDVTVLPIPMRSEYSDRIRERLWSNRMELHENAQRNAVEFASEGWDWRTVTEDEGMYRCSVSGELIHPVHCQPSYGEYYGEEET